ncbi:MAG: hypothetical protein C4346_20045 [Chloroflexota bacterium]
MSALTRFAQRQHLRRGAGGILGLQTVILMVLFAAMPKDPESVRATGSQPVSVTTIRLRPASGSAVKGRAVLRTYDGVTTVEVLLVQGEDRYVTEVRQGDCRNPPGKPLLPLADALPGMPATTLIDLSLAELMSKDAMVIVMRPAPDLSTLYQPVNVVACGQIGGGKPPAKPPRTGVAAPMANGWLPISVIGALGVACLSAGLILRYRER